MADLTVNRSQQKAAKFAGFAYILIIVLAMIKVNFLEPDLFVPKNGVFTVFRLGIVSDILMYVLVLLLSLALYITLKPVNQNLAFSAMFLRFGEGIVGSVVTIISGLIPLLIISGQGTEVFTTEQLQALVEIFRKVRTEGLDIVLIFIGFGGTIFCYLFFISKYIPGIIAIWGIFTYLSMLVLAVISILFPNHPAMIETLLYSFGGLFELVFGFWLLIKGLKLPAINEGS